MHRKLDSEVSEYRQLTDHWCLRKREKIPGYVFTTGDGAIFARIWERIGGKTAKRPAENQMALPLGKLLIDLFLGDSTLRGHDIRTLAHDLDHYLERASRPEGSSHEFRESRTESTGPKLRRLIK
jgi:hypothetical protein